MTKLSGPARRIAAASGVIVVLLAVVVGVTLWRSEQAASHDRDALASDVYRLRLEQARTLFWRERESMNEYLIRPSPEVAREIEAERAAFVAAIDGVRRDTEHEASLLAQLRAANDSFIAVFRRNHAAAAKGTVREQAIVVKLNDGEDRVLRPLRALAAINEDEVAGARSAASSARSQAFIVGL
ncbi:MAG TPA: hypothetical protein VE269_01250, partial [Gaiellaceae bacterium]|nr:hypothetical protein [Gaiellaceae bacterium]